MKAAGVLLFTVCSWCHVLGQAGTLDPTFDGDGIALMPDSVADWPILWFVNMLPQSGGGVLVGGKGIDGVNSSSVLVRLTDTGQWDLSYGTDGIAPVVQEGDVVSLHEVVNGNVVVVNNRMATNGPPAIVRLTASGGLDPTYGNNGYAALPAHAQYVTIGCIDAMERLYFLMRDSLTNWYLARITADGLMDTTLGVNGLTAPFQLSCTATWNVHDAVVLSDGRIAFVGGIQPCGPGYPSTLVRIFNDDGSVSVWTIDLDLPLSGTVLSVEASGGGSYVLSTGWSGAWDEMHSFWIQADTIASDHAFSFFGAPINGSASCTDALLDDLGRLVQIGSTASGHFAMARTYSDGTFDQTFGNAGQVGLSGLASFGSGRVRHQVDGRILALVKSSMGRSRVLRFHAELSTVLSSNDRDRTRLLLYPNPTSEFLRVRIRPDGPALGSLSIRDCTGRHYKANEVKQGVNELVLDVSDLAPGVYSVSVELLGAQDLERSFVVAR